MADSPGSKVTALLPLRLTFCAALVACLVAGGGRAEVPAGREAENEKRFPPLVLPSGFQATLFACDPMVEYPSAIAPGPRAGSLFVAAVYLTGLGNQTERRDEIRLVQDTDADGYADQ